MNEPEFILQEIDDPVQEARCRAQHERHRRNSDWLQAHWPDLLPQARGKFVAVAGEEAFLAGTAEEAWRWAAASHPDDNGAFVRYVPTAKGPRIYAHRRCLAMDLTRGRSGAHLDQTSFSPPQWLRTRPNKVALQPLSTVERSANTPTIRSDLR